MTHHENGAEKRVLRVLRNNRGRQLDLGFISREAHVHWFQALRVLNDIILLSLVNKHPEDLEDLDVIPEKTTKSWVFRPQLAVQEVP